MTQEHEITLDGFMLTGVDAYGVKWSTASVPGWHDAPPMRTERLPRAQQPGSHPATGHAGERLVTLSGMATATDTASLEDAARRFAAVLCTGSGGPLAMSSTYGALSAQVWLEDAPTFRPISWRHGMWSVTVAAPDPLLYGPPVFPSPATLSTATPGVGLTYPLAYPLDYGIAPGVTPGSLSLPNAGTAAYWPRLRIDGPVLNPAVTCVETGAWVRYMGTLTAGQWLDIDTANRRVLLQGQVSVRNKITSSGNWLAIPVGGASLSWTADTADPSALLSAWGYERAVA